MIVCFSPRDNCWRVYLLWDWPLCAVHRPVGPTFLSKDQAEAYIAAVRRGEASPREATASKNADHG